MTKPEVRCFPPVVGNAPHTLILGSAPGITSLIEVEYYAHKRNAFWPIMAELCGFDATLSYEERKTALTDAGFALWDVLAECERESSLDSDIIESTVVANDFATLFDELPTIRRVFFNGGKAESSFHRHVIPKLGPMAEQAAFARLPSTSPAYAAMRYPAKLGRWRSALGAGVPSRA
ncbi:MAG: hypoxanthine-DNA glycosylase [Bradymonadia bacterium]|jgi:hypoxanthine-DNA glycosylase